MEFKVGYNRQTVHPANPIPLAGYSNEPQRLHKAITEDICATAVAYSDGITTVLTIGTDLCTLGEPFATNARLGVCAATGLTEEQVFIAATHTHSGPAMQRDDFDSIVQYKKQFIEAISTAAKEAIADLKPAKMYAGSIETEKLNFVKHYKVRDNKTGEISCIGDQYGTDTGKTYIDHMTKADTTLHVVKFTREGGKDVVIANFRAHPHFTGGYFKYDLSSDYIGAFRMAFEAMYDCHCVYFQGACGNINSSTRMAGERLYTTCRSHGMGLAAAAYECIQKRMHEVAVAPIKTKQVKFYADINQTPNRTDRIIRMQCRHHQVTGQTRLHGNLCRLQVTNFPDHDHIRILTQNRTQRFCKRHVDFGIDLCLTHTVKIVFNRVFYRHDIQLFGVNTCQR